MRPMKSFKDFKNLTEAAGNKVPSAAKLARDESVAQKALEAALRAQAEASIERDLDGKEVRRTRRYYLQNNPTAGAAHRIKMDAANAAVMQAQSQVSMAQQMKANAAQAKAQAQQPQPTQTPPEQPAEVVAPMDAPNTNPTVEEPPSPELSPEQQKEQKRKEREKAALRKSINQAQRAGLDNMFS